MDMPNKTLAELFAQLGLDSDPSSIDTFFATHSLDHDAKLSEAPFWNASQAAFLREEILEDAEWAPVVDELNARLHER
ncbi:DUF2789 domain-containing protein [Halopseudomonas phragmitis]|uniref:DUF2789 domain-containing protein n=2 Tax=Pseudomonadaceae TaxID=135621 RepID=A0A1V0B7T1_9GAMM|nr:MULTISPECIES: DUF2789 domain-containing protein [Pseudomonadaceae]AQZ95967.1 hypothetical protein BVH74_14940 [Halopseudomonas phragmitis]RHW21153.1 DUF2789 domain-containing protein [Pseudomonas jilinensis]